MIGILDLYRMPALLVVENWFVKPKVLVLDFEDAYIFFFILSLIFSQKRKEEKEKTTGIIGGGGLGQWR